MNWLKKSLRRKCSLFTTGNEELKKLDAIKIFGLPKVCVGKPTSKLALDCEFVGVTGRDTDELGRVTIVNYYGHVVYDREVEEIIRNRILIGHSIKNDLSVLKLSHPKHLIRDTSSKESTLCPEYKISLKKLLSDHLKLEIQNGEHDSIEDARGALALFRLVENKWGQVPKKRTKTEGEPKKNYKTKNKRRVKK